MRQPSRLRTAIVVAAFLAVVAGAVLLGGRSSGWWRPSASGVVAATAAVAIAALAIILFVPAVEVLERWREEQPMLYWVLLAVGIMVSGIVIDVAITWLIAEGAP